MAGAAVTLSVVQEAFASFSVLFTSRGTGLEPRTSATGAVALAPLRRRLRNRSGFAYAIVGWLFVIGRSLIPT